MFTAQVDRKSLGERLDAGFYHPEYLLLDDHLASRGAVQLHTVVDGVSCGPFGGNAIADDLYAEEGVFFIRPLNITSNIFDESSLVKVPKQLLLDNRLKIYSGKNLYFGRVGVPCVAIIDAETSISPNIIIARLDESLADPEYLYAFSSSVYGLTQLKRQLKEVAQPTTSTEAVNNLKVFLPDVKSQKYIGDKVRQAERLRAWAKQLNLLISKKFSFLTKNLMAKQSHWRASTADLSPYRINPKQYDPVVLDMLEKAEGSYCQLVPLSEMLGSRGIAGGATPKGATYLEGGILFARVQNVKSLSLDLSDAVFIDSETDEELKRSRCEKDDIVLTITGYPGTASLVTEQDLPVNINQHSVRLHLKEVYPAGYVCAAINSDFVKIQVDRAAIGGTRDALDYPSVKNLLIPVLSSDEVKDIDYNVRCIIAANQVSKVLIASARSLVELLIEGKVTENELNNAQKSLDAGDNFYDREILSRITTKGLDGEGDPLFADLDQLYDLLAQCQQMDE